MKRAAFVAAALLAACSRPVVTPQEHFATLYRELHPGVVFLSMRAPSDDPRMHGKLDDAYGTGLVVESGDWGSRILTAEHVIDGGRNLRARVGDTRQSSSVRLIAQDKDQDLALLEVASAKNVAVPALGNSRDVAPGDQIALLGYPIPDAFADEGLGRTASIYIGHVASIRDAGTPNAAIELDLPIVPGESGGPVFTADGKVVGIAESRFDEEHAIGFATPMEIIEPFLRAHRRVKQ
ncbi:MAG: S1C family serine protease [Vulcanimicrobiaceae bacterium]